MPRGTYYPQELREEARRLQRDGWSLNEISDKLGPPKNTLSLWLRGIELTPKQRARLHEKERVLLGHNHALAAQVNRQARLARIDVQKKKAKAFLATATGTHRDNHIAAAMLYLAEGAKNEDACAFDNSNPQVIRYWLYLLRTSFDVDESKFCIQVLCRADQDPQQLITFWSQRRASTVLSKGTWISAHQESQQNVCITKAFAKYITTMLRSAATLTRSPMN